MSFCFVYIYFVYICCYMFCLFYLEKNVSSLCFVPQLFIIIGSCVFICFTSSLLISFHSFFGLFLILFKKYVLNFSSQLRWKHQIV